MYKQDKTWFSKQCKDKDLILRTVSRIEDFIFRNVFTIKTMFGKEGGENQWSVQNTVVQEGIDELHNSIKTSLQRALKVANFVINRVSTNIWKLLTLSNLWCCINNWSQHFALIFRKYRQIKWINESVKDYYNIFFRNVFGHMNTKCNPVSSVAMKCLVEICLMNL